MVYFYIQHKIYRIPGGSSSTKTFRDDLRSWSQPAYTYYSFFEWLLIIFDIMYDSVAELDFKHANLQVGIVINMLSIVMVGDKPNSFCRSPSSLRLTIEKSLRQECMWQSMIYRWTWLMIRPVLLNHQYQKISVSPSQQGGTRTSWNPLTRRLPPDHHCRGTTKLISDFLSNGGQLPVSPQTYTCVRKPYHIQSCLQTLSPCPSHSLYLLVDIHFSCAHALLFLSLGARYCRSWACSPFDTVPDIAIASPALFLGSYSRGQNDIASTFFFWTCCLCFR